MGIHQKKITPEWNVSDQAFGRIHPHAEEWVENMHVLYDSPLNAGHDYMGAAFSRFLFWLFIATGMLMGTVLYIRVGWLQVVEGNNYSLISENNRTRHITVDAERGLIYDRKGNALVKNIPRFSLRANTALLPHDEQRKERLISMIAGALLKNEQDVRATIDSALASMGGDAELYDSLTHEQAIALSIASIDEPALMLVSGVKRSYAIPSNDMSLSHVIGYEGKISEQELMEDNKGYARTDYIGKQGVERAYESVLRGIKGDRVMEVNAQGFQLSVLSEVLPVKGKDVILTIDSELQAVAHDALMSVLNEHHKYRGVVIVQATQTGELLAVVSAPSYDNELFATGLSAESYQEIMNDKNTPLINRAISGLYPSGSTIKPIMAVAGLAEGVIRPETTVLSTGGIAVGQWFFPDWKAGGHGRVRVREAIANSVNTFFYLLGGGDGEDRKGLGIERINSWFRQFGFGAKTGVDVGFEQEGLVPDPQWKFSQKQEEWYIGDTYNVSIGQGDVLVSPLQLTNAISAVANGGRLMKPFLAKKVGDETIQPALIREIIAPEFAFSEVQAGMRDAAVYGSARSLATIPMMVAGKTGTAQWSSSHPPHGWFVGFAPYQKPEITVTVLVEEGEEGSRTATPVAKKIFEWWSKHRYSLSS